jgi:hypothetical protein
MSTLLPSLYDSPASGNDEEKNDFSLNINFRNTDKLNTFFRTGLMLADNSTLTGRILSDSSIQISLNSREITYRGLEFGDLLIAADMHLPDLEVRLSTSSLNLLGQSELKGFRASLTSAPDNFVFSVDWDDRDQENNSGSFTARAEIIKPYRGADNAVMNITIDSTGIYNQDNLWSISPARISIDTTSITVENLFIRNLANYYSINGTMSENPSDTIHLGLNGIDIA